MLQAHNLQNIYVNVQLYIVTDKYIKVTKLCTHEMIYIVRASDRSQKHVKFCEISTHREKIRKRLILWEMCDNFLGQILLNLKSKKTADLMWISWTNWLECNPFCTELTNIFDPFTPNSDLIAELRQPEGPPSGAPYPYRKLKETHELIFSWLSWLAVLLVGAYARWRWWRRRWNRTRWQPSSECNRLTEHADLHVVFKVVLFRYMTSCYDQLTAVKSSYPLTSTKWLYHRLIQVYSSSSSRVY